MRPGCLSFFRQLVDFIHLPRRSYYLLIALLHISSSGTALPTTTSCPSSTYCLLSLRIASLRLRGGLPTTAPILSPQDHLARAVTSCTAHPVASELTNDDDALVGLDAPVRSPEEALLLRAYLYDALGFAHPRLHFLWWLVGLGGGFLIGTWSEGGAGNLFADFRANPLSAAVRAARLVWGVPLLINLLACWALQYALVLRPTR